MKTILTKWEIRTYDVWGNAEEGFEVNNVFSRGTIELRLTVELNNANSQFEFKSAYPTDRQLQRVFGTRASIETDGDDMHIYVNRSKDAYPLGELYCISHYSLSPIRAIPAINNSKLQRAFRFFFKHAGYVVGSRAAGALALARAEQWAEKTGIHYHWNFDDSQPIEDALGDHEYWCSNARRIKAGYTPEGKAKAYKEYAEGWPCEHEITCCIAHDAHNETVASLGAIIDADADYRRVVQAELALEAMSTKAGS